MTLTQYLGTGSVSRGRLTINSDLKTIVSQSPYLNDGNDTAAVVQGVQNLVDALNGVSGLTWIKPTKSQSAKSFVASVITNSPACRMVSYLLLTPLDSHNRRVKKL
jgi:cellobiose dehydrogenase (acceptor)